MDDEVLGGRFSIDISDLKAGIAQANRLIRESESEFRAAAAGMDDWTKSQEGLEKRQASLNKQIDIQKEKVSALTKEKERIIEEMVREGKTAEEIAKATDSLNKSITNESKQLDRLKVELNKTEKALDEMGDETTDAADAMENIEKAAKDAGDGFTIAKGAIASFVGNGLSALTGAAKDAISSILGLEDATRESRSEMAKLETSFQTSGLSAENAKRTYTDLYGIMGDESAAVEAAQHLAKISKNEYELAENTKILTGVMAEYGKSIPLEGLAEGIASSSAMSSVQGVLADALEWQGVNLDNFNEKLAVFSTEQERAALIQETLIGLYGESANIYMENNAQVIEANKLQANYNDTINKFGEKVEPITNKVKEGFAKILEKVLELVEGVDMDAFGASIDGAFTTFTEKILPAIVNGLQWIIDNKDVLIAGLVGIGTAMMVMNVANMIMGVVKAFKAFKLANEGATAAQWLLNAAMNANPIGIIVAAIAGLVTAIAVLWNNCDAFREFWIGLWDGIKNTASTVGDWLGNLFTVTIPNAFKKMWSGLTDGASKAWKGVQDTFAKAASFFGDIFSQAWSKVREVFSVGGKIFDGIKEGIVKAFKVVVNAIIKGINKVVKIPFEGLNRILNTISGLSIAGVQPFSWLTWRAPVPQIPLLAQGGVVRKATTAIIGEDGAEAIVPLEKNTQWIKKLAKEIALEQSQSVIVNQYNTYSQPHSRYEMWQSRDNTVSAVKLALLGG